MSNEGPTSPRSRLWAGAGCLLGCAVMAWIAIRLLLQVWVPLLIVLGIVGVVVSVVAIWRRRRW